MRKYLNILTVLILFSGQLVAQSVSDGLVNAIKNGNAKQLSEYFHQSLEMTILDKDYMSSKNQATRIMEEFFKENKPTGFEISFEGTKEKSKYAIGIMTTADQSFRINLYFLNRNGDRLIYYLSIEKESSYEL